jgi:hypothetical protein
MLTSEIIAIGRSQADVPNTNFYTDADALRSVNMAYKQIYAELAMNNDDDFVTQYAIPALTAISNRQNTYTFDMSSLTGGMYRLRMLQYQAGDFWRPVEKMTIENFGSPQADPAYRLEQQKLWIFARNSYNYEIWYYPQPATLTLTPTDTDVTYPLSVVPEIISYQVAADIRRKQSLPTEAYERRRNELWATMIKQLRRDDFRPEKVSNDFAKGWQPWR